VTREDIHKLLGGYATGTLTAEEREALFAAALEEQELFDALAGEQPLHDLLRDPSARAQLLAALEERPAPWYRVWWRPGLAVAAMAAVAVFAVVAVREKPQTEVAQVVRPKLKVFEPPPAAAPAPRQFQIPQPPKVAVPKLDRAPAPLPIPAPAAAPPPPPPQPQAEVAAAPKALEVRAVAGLASDAVTMKAAPLAAVPGRIPYNVLRKQPDGSFAVADPQRLQKGDAIELRFQPNESGYISVAAVDEAGNSHVIASSFIARPAAFTTPVLPPGATRLEVSFSRGQIGAVSGFVDRPAREKDLAPANSQQVVFSITLSYR
jgi:hypothetical protein